MGPPPEPGNALTIGRGVFSGCVVAVAAISAGVAVTMAVAVGMTSGGARQTEPVMVLESNVT